MITSPRNKISFLLIFLFVVLISACVQTENLQAPTNTEKIPPALPSQTLTPKEFSTKISTSTQTPDSYSATFSAQFVTSKARTAATRTAAFATLTSRNAICDNGYGYGFFAEDQLKGLDYYSTNSGESWTVVKCVPEKAKLSNGYTKVINSDSSKIWKISYESLPLPDRYEFISGYKIDPTGNFLYLVPRIFFGRDGWCPVCFFGYGSPLYRLNLSSGEIATILPYIDNGYYVDMTISPDVRYLVYSDSRDGNHVYIKDLIGGDDQKVELEKDYAINGGFTWTPDSKNLIFAAGVDGWEDGKAGISLFQINLSTLRLKTLLFNDSRNLVPWFNSTTSQFWLADNVLNLTSIKIKKEDSSWDEWSINIKTGDIVFLLTPTPTSTP